MTLNRSTTGLILLGLIFIEGVLKHFLAGFPFDAAVAAELGVYATFAATRTVTDVKNAKVETGDPGTGAAHG
jgi:hypothetical protein